jgi:hypothetical protein
VEGDSKKKRTGRRRRAKITDETRAQVQKMVKAGKTGNEIRSSFENFYPKRSQHQESAPAGAKTQEESLLVCEFWASSNCKRLALRRGSDEGRAPAHKIQCAFFPTSLQQRSSSKLFLVSARASK